ncbi:MAG TPA: hypothetical protein DD808_17840 [Halieaceae bacterium]|uniref:conjugal transfer protein TraG N-terminal domain-containing protein n=1 Tax=Haliea sp. TaxID=1932666 RepID=UPI000C372143|nr:conjugal transfer protein TraG N-terminal domain-containing protein [Haliea sp.]MAD65556.1 hypothetical protein [Haliea sp.]MAY92308.1 hypothetical protein [Haliea sp.]MBP70730.1 hypothetical protein [Haliea sp.]HBQ42406.1 hypothetical protein [Halieaceae bacterium]|tara:strand:+ start:2994 stop:4652 length:1659 start_codon:yes stop_codon:yes gene_type:complete
MGVASYFEFVTTLFSWILYQGIWAVLVDSGIVFIPIIAMVLGNCLDSHKGGDDEGSAAIQSLKKIEADFIAMLGVLIFAGIPLLEVRLADMEYNKPALRCTEAAETIPGTDTGTTYDTTLAAMGDQTGSIPLWWAMMHWLSKAVTAASVAAIPCSYDVATIDYRLAEANLEDPDLNRELEQFKRDCWQPSLARLSRTGMGSMTAEEKAEVTWLGSAYLQGSGLYDRYHSAVPNPQWSFDPARDAGFEQYASAGGFPACSDWWANSTLGLRRRVLDYLPADVRDEMIYSADNLVERTSTVSLSTSEREDVFLRKYLSVKRTTEAVSSDMPLAVTYGDGAKQVRQGRFADWRNSDSVLLQTAGTMLNHGAYLIMGEAARDVGVAGMAFVGSALKAPAAIGEGYAMRNGISLFQPLALMMMVIALPFLLIFGRYSLRSLITLSIIYFGFHFLTFIWAVAFWTDNNLMHLLTSAGGLSVFASGTSATQSLILLYISRFLYIVFPLLYLTAVGWVGYQTGGAANELSNFGTRSGAIGNAGGAAVGQVASKAATKGKA